MLLELVELPDLAPDYVAAPPRWFRPFWMFCSVKNCSDSPIFVYGPRHQLATTKIPASLFVLPPGLRTPAFWDCKGIFIPSDCAAQTKRGITRGPLALKYRDFRRVVVRGDDHILVCSSPDDILDFRQDHFPIPQLTIEQLHELPKQVVRVPEKPTTSSRSSGMNLI